MEKNSSEDQLAFICLQRPRSLLFPLYALWCTALLSAVIALLTVLSALVELPSCLWQFLPLCVIVTGGFALLSIQRFAQRARGRSYLMFEREGQPISVSRKYLEALIEQELRSLYGKRVTNSVCRLLLAEERGLLVDLSLPRNWGEALFPEQLEKSACPQIPRDESSSGHCDAVAQQALPSPEQLKDQLTHSLHRWLGGALRLQVVLSVGFQETTSTQIEAVHPGIGRESHG